MDLLKQTTQIEKLLTEFICIRGINILILGFADLYFEYYGTKYINKISAIKELTNNRLAIGYLSGTLRIHNFNDKQENIFNDTQFRGIDLSNPVSAIHQLNDDIIICGYGDMAKIFIWNIKNSTESKLWCVDKFPCKYDSIYLITENLIGYISNISGEFVTLNLITGSAQPYPEGNAMKFLNDKILLNICNRHIHSIVLCELKTIKEFAERFYEDSLENKFVHSADGIFWNGAYGGKSIILNSRKITKMIPINNNVIVIENYRSNDTVSLIDENLNLVHNFNKPRGKVKYAIQSKNNIAILVNGFVEIYEMMSGMYIGTIKSTCKIKILANFCDGFVIVDNKSIIRIIK